MRAREAWSLVLELLLAERRRVPAIAGALRLSAAQCHVLRHLEPGKPVPMRRVAEAPASSIGSRPAASSSGAPPRTIGVCASS